ncbi:MAG: S-layer homology domain-containing protein [Clostridia bacterium]|nr:S-layer homology domain-containing protein [Clostridia bacterium]
MKKIILFIMLISVILPGVAFAEVDKELESAIIAAKTVIDIPAEYSEFDYNVRENNGRKNWNLSWRKEDSYSDSIRVTVKDTGDILNYSHYASDNEKGELITMDKAIEIATAFASKILGDNFSKMRLENKEKIPLNSYSDAFCIDFKRYENDIPVYGQNCRVSVDKFTGMVESYSGFAYDRKSVFEKPENLIGTDSALSAFVGGDGMTLAYRTYRGYGKDEQLKVFPVYRYNGRNYVIDAQTGENLLMKDLIKDAEDNDLMFSAAPENAAGGALKDDVALTPQEQAAVDELDGMLTEDDVRKILENAVPEFKNHSFDQSRFYKNYYDDGFGIQLEYRDEDNYFGNATVDAVTGEIKYYYFYTDKLPASGEEITDEKVAELTKKLSGEKFDSFVQGEKSVSEWDGRKYEYHHFTRMENGVPVEGNEISVQADVKKGYINQYSLNWDDIESFPDISDIKSKEEVLNRIAEKNNLGLCYINGGLVYGYFGQGSLDPRTGNFINYNGTEFKEKTVPNYTDISGHWAEEIITRMVENGLSLEGDKFCPDDKVTQKEFLEILEYNSVYNNDEEIEKSLRSYFSEVDVDAPVSRKEAAKVFAKNMGYGEIASRAELFKLPFEDCREDEYVGYIAICKSYGIMQGKADGTFGSADMLTRAEVVTMVYRDLCRK